MRWGKRREPCRATCLRRACNAGIAGVAVTVRRALCGLGLLTMAAPGWAQVGPPAPAACDAHFNPPRAPQMLTRKLVRDLADGKQIIVSRSYRIRFIRQGKGWRVDGEQVAVTVDSPPPLAALAALERERQDRETFPIALDRQGRILPAPPRTGPTAAPQNGKAVDDILANAHLTPAQRASLKAVSHAMLAPGAAVATPWPADLFDAPPGTRQDSTHPSLPDGTQGDVTVTITATHADCGRAAWPATRQTQREVMTTLGGKTRHTLEVWTLEAAPAAPER